jgi:hypothetical protein
VPTAQSPNILIVLNVFTVGLVHPQIPNDYLYRMSFNITNASSIFACNVPTVPTCSDIMFSAPKNISRSYRIVKVGE